MAKPLREFEAQVSCWPQISIHPHRFGGKEFRFDHAELGHIHTEGTLDIPFPRSIRDALLQEGLAEKHRWIPNSGWTTFHIRGHHDLAHALWLMRISYLRYVLRKTPDATKLLVQESAALSLIPTVTSLLLGPYLRPSVM